MAQIFCLLVDGTDFATVESAITESDFNSGATRKFYGINHGVSDAFTSGTISKTGRLVRSGVIQLTLKGTENNYDVMQVRVTKNGIADQVIEWVNEDYDESDIYSAVLLTQSMASDAHSAATQANSRVLLVQSRLSDLDSRLVSDISDVLSQLTVVQSMASDAHSAAAQGSSRTLLVQSRLSDLDSRLVSDVSDIYSLLSDLNSNILSRVPKAVATNSQLSDLASDLRSYLVGLSGTLSDVHSAVSDAHSDLASKIAGITASVSASDISDIASAVRATLVSDLSDILSAAQQTNSRALVNQSRVSDVYSMLSDLQSDFQSRVPKRVATDSQLSDLASDIKSAVGNVSVTITASDISDIASAVVAALPITSAVSDIYSLLSDLNSNFHSRIPKEPAARSQLSDHHSDLRSQIGGIAASVSASDISDIASAVRAILVSDLSDILSAAQQTNSRALVNQSRVSDIYSLLSDFQSDFGSRVPKEVAARSQLSDLASDLASDLKSFIGAGVELGASSLSDLRSAITGATFTLTASDLSDIGSRVYAVLASDLSDILSAAQQGNSRALINQSRISDVASAIAAGVELGASSLSDIRSAITANGVLRAGAEPTTVIGHTDTLAAKVDWLGALAKNKILQTATLQSLRNNADNSTIASAVVSDDGTTFTRAPWLST